MKIYHFITIISLLISSVVLAQVRQVSTTTMVKPIYQMKDYKLSPVFVKRQTQYQSTFNPSGKTYTYPDNSRMSIHLVKNPSFAGQSTIIKPVVSNGPIHGQTNTPPSTPSGFTCVTNRVMLTAQSTNFLNADYSAQSLHLYPGAIYTFDNFFNGSYKEESGGRNTITIGSDNPNVKVSYVTVPTPDQFKIHDAIAQLFGNAYGQTGTGSLEYHMYESSNSADLNIKVTAGGSGYGFTFSNVFNATNQQKHEYLTIDARKELFTLYTVPPDNGFFTDPSHEGTPNLMYIGSVTYGVRVLANLEVTFNSQSDADNFKASYDGYGMTGNVDLDFLSNNSSVATTINAYVVGGPGNSTISFNKADLKTQIQNILANASYQNARPLSYTLYDMAGDAIGSESATDYFYTQTCYPVNQAINLTSATVTIVTGDDGKDHDTHYWYTLYNGAGSQVASYTNTSDNSEFQSGGQQYSNALSTNPAPITDFANGGQLRIDIQPNGHDTWKITQATLTLTFSNGLTKRVVLGPSVLSQNNKQYNYYFDNSFNAR